MTDKKKLKTINLKGREYVQVDTRVEFFNEAYPQGSITTSFTKVLPTDYIDTKTGHHEKAAYIFSAQVTPDTASPERFFTGHSYGEIGKEKAMEKLETVAVGRALAFMGIGIVEGIASADEIQKWQENAWETKATPKAPKGIKPWRKVAEGETHECKTCASPATRSYGVSKQGKDYNMIQCDETKEHVEFLEVNPDEQISF